MLIRNKVNALPIVYYIISTPAFIIYIRKMQSEFKIDIILQF